jgi:superfamily II DNA or RNA helicase
MTSLIPGFLGTIIGGRGSEPRPDDVRRLRPSQRKVYDELEGLPHTILNSPAGWGKTTVLIFLAMSRLLSNPKLKVLITVPQRIVGDGFSRKLTIELPDSTTAAWHPTDLCEKMPTKTLRLTKWLATPGEDLANRVVVTTHAALVAAFARIEDPARAFYETIVIIDEGHHIQTGDTDYEGYNRLSAVIKPLITLGVCVWLVTAFFFRGDKLPILEESQLCKFKRLFIPFDEHLAELIHIRS